jgi:hypothetical protein
MPSWGQVNQLQNLKNIKYISSMIRKRDLNWSRFTKSKTYANVWYISWIAGIIYLIIFN